MRSFISMSDAILSVKDLTIQYRIKKYPIVTLRDKFIHLLKDPFSIFHSPSYYNVLKGVNLQFSKGEVVALLGVNGSGKSSLCRYLSQICKPQIGQVLANGKIKAIFNTDVGVIPELSGRENAFLLASMMYPELSNNEIKKIADEAISFSELGEYADVAFQYYSKGMKARMYLSLISSEPADILILDEVFDGADVFFNHKVSIRIKDMIKNSGVVIFVSHSLEHVTEVCNRGIVLNGGAVAYDGAIDGAKNYYLEHCSLQG